MTHHGDDRHVWCRRTVKHRTVKHVFHGPKLATPSVSRSEIGDTKFDMLFIVTYSRKNTSIDARMSLKWPKWVLEKAKIKSAAKQWCHISFESTAYLDNLCDLAELGVNYSYRYKHFNPCPHCPCL